MATLREVKEWLEALPEEFLDFEVVNGEEGKIDDQYTYRIDKPIVCLMVDEETKEIAFLNVPADEAEVKID
jgi:hypothetical protein